jgi:hypothetical protein
MAYISYKDLPIYFGTLADGGGLDATDPGSKMVFAQQVQLNYTPNIAPTRLLGKTPTKDNFNLAGPPSASLSFSCYVDAGEFDPTDYTGDVGNVGSYFAIGGGANGITGSGAYLTSFSYTLAPYQPVLVQCDFAIYQPLTTTNVGGKIGTGANTSWVDSTDFNTYAHGAYSVFSGQGQTAAQTLDDISVYESVQYQFSANRMPIYEIGDYGPSVVELMTAEHSLSIQGNNIQKLVPLTGSNPGKLNLLLKNSAGDPCFSSAVNGRITAENVSIQGGDLARGNITITELLK